MRQPGWIVNKEIYNDTKICTAYKEYIINILKCSNSTNTNLEDDMENMFELEKKFGMVIQFQL